MWEIQLNWNDVWMTMKSGFLTRDYAEWAAGAWKQRNQCYGDPFRVVQSEPDPFADSFDPAKDIVQIVHEAQ